MTHLALSHMLDMFNMSLPRFLDIGGGSVLEGGLILDPEELVESAESEKEEKAELERSQYVMVVGGKDEIHMVICACALFSYFNIKYPLDI